MGCLKSIQSIFEYKQIVPFCMTDKIYRFILNITERTFFYSYNKTNIIINNTWSQYKYDSSGLVCFENKVVSLKNLYHILSVAYLSGK